MKDGFLYLTAYIDMYSRKIVGWGLSNTMTVDWCLDVLKRAISQHGCPEIINSDQGSQYTSNMWQSFMEQKMGIQISMDGKGRAINNLFIERLYRSVKYAHTFLYAHQNGNELCVAFKRYFDFYNFVRLHQRLDYDKPASWYLQHTA